MQQIIARAGYINQDTQAVNDYYAFYMSILMQKKSVWYHLYDLIRNPPPLSLQNFKLL